MPDSRPSQISLWWLAAVLPVIATSACKKDHLSEDELPSNFHTLDSGRAYRSSQPTDQQLKDLIDVYKIRTVINLRGPNPGQPWYDAEAATCTAKGVKLVNHRMSARALPPPDVLKGIVETLQTAEYPILIHCSGGADRTGAVSAIYRMLIQHQDRETASQELAYEFGHLSDFSPWMDTLVAVYEPKPEWLAWYAANVEHIRCVISPDSAPATSSAPASEPARD